MAISDIERAVNPDDEHYPKTTLIILENTYGEKNGFPIEPTYFDEIGALAASHNLRVHLDGARLFNAAVALDVDVSEITQHVDSVSFCLSKGLCAPAGSVLCGSEEFIYRARRTRKVLGGGMRQAGVLAAAGIVALDEMVDRMSIDHKNARMLAEGLARIPYVHLDIDHIRTNIIFFELAKDAPVDAYELADLLRQEANIWIGACERRLIRVLTHYWVGEPEVELLLSHTREILTR
jgi:threonine aldolase